ncbi:hypothetical protein A33Q_1166 [Indibacter alkaliphilus LW1]|uniref:3-oxoacyl-ACP synthase n=1 Tax=Indibacter alkaliphilus (strain CCUG 57479 / KCTC 22604 / LW1) TaxID=1189612 RepID=S2DHM3_INDAL|nr:hypothetical protein [Indibacter alkaliphilus]EOZ98512.1 hypothetical protein A33Q_1166 [Indibacter alkaliphilus LW1]
MEWQTETKERLLSTAKKSLQEQVHNLEKELKEVQESSEVEEKSSAGDKFETHQEMINQHRTLLEKRLSGVRMMLRQLNAVPVKATKTVQEGSLIKLPMGNIWVSVAFGKIVLDDQSYQMVSPDSPLIQALWGLEEGGSGNFRDKQLKIEALQ